MNDHCSAKFCNQKRVPGVMFYKFPEKRDTQRFNIWRTRLQVDDVQNSAKLYACQFHFSPNQYSKFGSIRAPERNQLSRKAVPDQDLVNPHKIDCRFCLEPSDCGLYKIFNEYPNLDVPTADEIQEMLGIQIDPNDQLPQSMCVTCVTKIKYIKRIRTQFQTNDLKLRQSLQPVPSTPSAALKVTLHSVDVSSAPIPPLIRSYQPSAKIFPADEDDVLESFCPEPDFEATNSIQVHAGDQSSNVEAAQLLTADQIAVVGKYEEIESTQVVRTEPTKQEKSIVDHTLLLYTGNFVDPPEIQQVVDAPTYADFDYMDYLDDSQSDEAETSPEKKARMYRPFRYTKRQRAGDL